jgi:DNA-binding transcriptional LysR family regulator
MTAPRDWTDRIGRRVKLRDLHILLAVAHAGSMGKAAAELAVSQPVVSKAIADLERALKVRLLDRSSQGVELTLYGREVLKCGTAVFDDLRKGVEALEFLSDPTSGELRIGCTEPLAGAFVGAVIERLLRKYPRASFNVITADPFALRDRELQQRNVDLVVTPTERMTPNQEMEVEVLFDDRQVIMTSAESKWARRRGFSLRDLMGERWFVPPPDSPIGAHISDCFRAAGLEPPRPLMASFSIPLCLRMVEKEGFLAMLPISMLVHGEHWRLRLLRVDAPHIPRPTGIVTMKNRTLGPLAQEFIASARGFSKALVNRAHGLGQSPKSVFARVNS